MSEISQNPGGGQDAEINHETPLPSAIPNTNIQSTEALPAAPAPTATVEKLALPTATAATNANALTEELPALNVAAVPNTIPATPINTEQVTQDQTKPDQSGNTEICPSPVAAVQNKIQELKNDIQNKTQDSGDWHQRENQLLKIIEDLEKVKCDAGVDGLKLELKVREEEIDLLKARINNLETELQASLSKPGAKNHDMIESIKQQHEELLTKARGMIFDKTKMVKNQELQIEALNTQVQSLKDINGITKDMLTIRNAEVKSLEERLKVMEAKFKSEKDRFDLMLKKAETNTSLNADLKKEYETQLAIFKELRGKYEERVQALATENERLKQAQVQAQGNPSAT